MMFKIFLFLFFPLSWMNHFDNHCVFVIPSIKKADAMVFRLWISEYESVEFLNNNESGNFTKIGNVIDFNNTHFSPVHQCVRHKQIALFLRFRFLHTIRGRHDTLTLYQLQINIAYANTNTNVKCNTYHNQ